jgi:hypothetical protein
VVGINSFKSNGQYSAPPGNAVDHVVFQFEYLPGEHRMNPLDSSGNHTNAGGYPASEMRKYLTPTGDGGSGNFLDGLKAAGVPESVLWGPSRVVSKTGYSETSTLTDLLWLPTAREMLGNNPDDMAAAGEDASNQARLEYYATKTLIKKKVGDDSAFDYWLASATSENTYRFCRITNAGEAWTQNANYLLGVAPAFCVQ